MQLCFFWKYDTVWDHAALEYFGRKLKHRRAKKIFLLNFICKFCATSNCLIDYQIQVHDTYLHSAPIFFRNILNSSKYQLIFILPNVTKYSSVCHTSFTGGGLGNEKSVFFHLVTKLISNWHRRIVKMKRQCPPSQRKRVRYVISPVHFIVNWCILFASLLVACENDFDAVTQISPDCSDYSIFHFTSSGSTEIHLLWIVPTVFCTLMVVLFILLV